MRKSRVIANPLHKIVIASLPFYWQARQSHPRKNSCKETNSEIASPPEDGSASGGVAIKASSLPAGRQARNDKKKDRLLASLKKSAAALILFVLFLCPPQGMTEEPAAAPVSAFSLDPEIMKNLIRFQEPESLTFNELLSLSENPFPEGALAEKVSRVFRFPVISNEASLDRGARPHRPRNVVLGNFLRVMSWNIEKSIYLDEAISAFTREDAYKKLIDPEKAPPASKQYLQTLAERKALESADIIILQEMDVGMKRSGYKNAPRELATALNMNYVYAPAYLEIDKWNLGMTEKMEELDKKEQDAFDEWVKVDSTRYKGFFGSAVLSRYPVLSAEVIPLRYQAYDWYSGEKSKTTILEDTRRGATKTVFLERLMREMKVGGRHFFRVDLYVPDLPEKRLTVINVHLEIKCPPAKRERQMREILGYIREIRNPVIVAGDFNAAPGDLSPTSIKREFRNLASSPTFWFSQAVNYLTPQGIAINIIRGTTNFTKNLQNPTAKHIPVIGPNKLYSLFKRIENYRFEDDLAFDFRGDKKRSWKKKSRLLSNSNQRDAVGYKMTFTTDRTFFSNFGKYRLDWMFVKAYSFDPRDKNESYRFAPHFARTLNRLNKNLKVRISDHDPNIVDLPFEEPGIKSLS